MFELFATQQRIKIELLLMKASRVLMMMARLMNGVTTKAQDGLMEPMLMIIRMILLMINGGIGENMEKMMIKKKGDLSEPYLLNKR